MTEKQFHPALLDELTPQQQAYVTYRMQGMSPHLANRKADFSDRHYKTLEKHPKIREILDAHYADMQEQFNVTHEKVIAGILSGIETCKLQADGVGMITGWEKLAKFCGIHAPERTELFLSLEGRALQDSLAALDERRLLELVGKQRQLVVDAEFEELPNG